MRVFKSKVCVRCTGVFTPLSVKSKSCGSFKEKTSCTAILARIRKNNSRNKQRVERPCVNCGKTYTASPGSNRKYCGSIKDKVGCSFFFRKNPNGTIRDLSMAFKCKSCGIDFMPQTGTHFYCGSRDFKTGCSYERYLKWVEIKRSKYTKEQKEIQAKYKLNRKLLIKYKMKPEDFESKLIEQDYKCSICGKKNNESSFHKKLYIDHNHSTNKIRGLLCTHCNSGIGMFMESNEIMLNAINYLNKWKNI